MFLICLLLHADLFDCLVVYLFSVACLCVMFVLEFVVDFVLLFVFDIAFVYWLGLRICCLIIYACGLGCLWCSCFVFVCC